MSRVTWTQLPSWWRYATPAQRNSTIRAIRMGLDVPSWFMVKPHHERSMVRDWVDQHGGQVRVRFETIGAPPRLYSKFVNAPTPAYPKPNGGNRILPSRYTKLRSQWVRSTGVPQQPYTMNKGHLTNTIALLNESHGNFVNRATEFLGRIAAHLEGQPAMMDLLEKLTLGLQYMTVDEMYPIVRRLQDALDGHEQFDDQMDGLDIPFD